MMPGWAPEIECACVHPSSHECVRKRYGRLYCLGESEPFDSSTDDPCECDCHYHDDEDE